jgi:hypothetical protein
LKEIDFELWYGVLIVVEAEASHAQVPKIWQEIDSAYEIQRRRIKAKTMKNDGTEYIVIPLCGSKSRLP